MLFPTWFTKLMKNEPATKKKTNNGWIIDESKCLSLAEVSCLRSTARKRQKTGVRLQKFNQVRDWFMVELALNTGLRVSEMTSLSHHNLLIDGDRSSITVLGKGNKKRAIWISSRFKNTCSEYIKVKESFGHGINAESTLLNRSNGSSITKRGLQKAFKNILYKARLPCYYYIHCLRHTYATFLLKASNYNYRFVQQQLGHASIRTTQVYANVLESDGKKAVERLFA